MTIDTQITLDLEPSVLCELRREDRTVSTLAEKCDEAADAGFGTQPIAGRVISSFQQVAPVWVSYDIVSRSVAGRVMRTDTVVEPENGVFDVTISAALFLKNANHPLLAQIKNTFDNTVLDDAFDLQDVVAGLRLQGVEDADYLVSLSYEIRNAGSMNPLTPNVDSLVAYLQQTTDTNGKPLYNVEYHVAAESCAAPVTVPYDDFIVDSPDKIAESVKADGCDVPITRNAHIGRKDQHFQHTFITKMKDIRIGRCKIVKTKVWVLANRVVREEIYGWVTTERNASEGMDIAIRNIIAQCAAEIDAATNIKAKKDVSAISASFRALVLSKIQAWFPDGMRCLDAGIRIVQECEDWDEVFP